MYNNTLVLLNYPNMVISYRVICHQLKQQRKYLDYERHYYNFSIHMHNSMPYKM